MVTNRLLNYIEAFSSPKFDSDGIELKPQQCFTVSKDTKKMLYSFIVNTIHRNS